MPLLSLSSSSEPEPSLVSVGSASSSAAVVEGVGVIVFVGDVPSEKVGSPVVVSVSGLSVVGGCDVAPSTAVDVGEVVWSSRVGSVVGDGVSDEVRIVVTGSCIPVSCPAEGVGCTVVGHTVVVMVVCGLRGHSTSTRCPVTIKLSSESSSASSELQVLWMRSAAASSPCTQLAEHWFPVTKSDTAQPDTGIEYARMHLDDTFSDVMIWKLVMESATVVDGPSKTRSTKACHDGIL